MATPTTGATTVNDDPLAGAGAGASMARAAVAEAAMTTRPALRSFFISMRSVETKRELKKLYIYIYITPFEVEE